MASPQPTWRSCCYYCIFNDQHCIFNDQQKRFKLMPTDQFRFDINIDSLLTDHANSHTTITPLNHSSSLYIDCKSFFQEQGQAFLRTHLTNPIFPPESLFLGGIIDEVQQSFKFDESFASDHGKPWVPNVFHLVLEVIIYMWEVEVGEHEAMEESMQEEEVGEHEAIEESMQEIRMIPTSMDAIDSLKKSKFELCNTCLKDFDGGDEVLPMTCGCMKKFEFKFTKQCNICMEGFDGGDEVLPMPCGHVFHLHCLEQWLCNSHTCPLCRFAMPTANKDNANKNN